MIEQKYTARAFSLIELSIVLVILGLLVGGILSGQALINAAGLRSVTRDEAKYAVAALTFRDKYFAYPGDMNNATRFWGRQNSNADCITNSGATVTAAGTCDGNGDGIVISAGIQGVSDETFQFWRQLSIAGLIEGTYTGYYGAAGAPGTDKTNTPQGKYNNGLWQFGATTSATTGHASVFDRPALNSIFQYGAVGTTNQSGNRNPTLKPEDAWNIDTKIDDGKPATGNFSVRVNEDYQPLSDCTTASSTSDMTAQYQLTRNAIGCVGLFYRVY